MIKFLVTCIIAIMSFKTLATSTTILIYHHVSSDTPPSTSISIEQFRAHMKLLKEEYQVIGIPEMVHKLRNNEPLPDKSVAITFDDGFRNILENAHPILKTHGFPYSIFVNTVDIGVGGKMTWDELRSLQDDGVTIANHFYDHRHLLDTRQFKSKKDWLKETATLLLKAEEELEKELGTSHKYLAYPYGEFNQQIQSILNEHNFIGFAQHSGAVGVYTDLTAIPRFPAAGIYAGLNSLKVKLSSLNMPVISISDQPLNYIKQTQASYSMEIVTEDLRPSQFQCFYNNKNVPLKWQDNKVHIAIKETLSAGRHRVNCTVPSIKKPGRFYWHSQPWFVANADGSWLE